MNHCTADAGRPTILLATVRRWPFAARLAMALHDAGFSVEAWCPAGHPLCNTRAVSRTHTASAFRPAASLGRAVELVSPDLIVPTDDQTTAYLHALHRQLSGSHIGAIIERSLGAATSFAVTASRAGLLSLAQSRSIPAPETAVIPSAAHLRTWLSTHGFPAFLKADGTSGGTGVRRVASFDEAAAAFAQLDAPPSALKAVKRAIVDGDPALVSPCLHRERPVITVQSHVPGTDANSAIFCWQGQVLASIAVEVLQTRNTHGPSTVVRVMEDETIDHAARELAAALDLNGFYGLDFVLEERTRQPLLIEMNARATQIAHLALGSHRDLAAAAMAAITECSIPARSVTPRPAVTGADVIALFPQEWYRDPASRYLQTAYHDVPWSEPDLMSFCIRNKPGWRRWLTREHWQGRRTGAPSPLASIAQPLPPGEQ
jgi:hypothetical protein